MKKRILSLVLSLSIVATGIFGLTGCFGGGQTPPPTNKPKASTKEVYSMSAVSSVTYMGSVAAASAMAETNRPAEITEPIFDNLKTYMLMFENMLVNDGFDIVSSTPSIEVDGEIYGAYKIKVAVNVNGQAYTMYYNETGTTIEVDADDTDEEIEENTTLEGKLVYGDVVYDITGKRTIETEGTEKEVEVEFTTKSVANPDNYIVVTQEIEANETSYEYKIYEGGRLVSEQEIEWEVENGKHELGIEFLINGVETEFEVEAVSATKFVISYKVNEVEHKIDVTKTETGYTFVYSNGYQEDVVL